MIESTVDPRLVERRRQVRADARRIRTRRWMVLGTVTAVIALAIAVVLSPLLDVDQVKVRGASHLTGDQIAEASGIVHGDQLVSVDLDDARTRLKADPWIASAQLTRQFPGTVDVKIIEEQPLLEFVTNDGSLVVSRTGRVLEGVQGSASEPSGTNGIVLPRVEYAGSTDELATSDAAGDLSDMVGQRPRGVLTDAVILVKRIPTDLLAKVVAVRIGSDKNVTLVLSDDAEVKLGQPDDVEAKLVATQAVLSQVVLDCLRSIDVREPTRAAVSRGPGCPGISPELASSSGDSERSSSSGSSDRSSSSSAAEGVDGAGGDNTRSSETSSDDSNAGA